MMTETPRDERLLSDDDRSSIWSHNGGLGEYRPDRDREFLDALVWRGEQIDRLLAGYAALTEQLTADEVRAQEADELLYLAWTVIANAGSGMGGWEHESGGWVSAAERWRDRWHEFIGPSREALAGRADGGMMSEQDTVVA